MNFVRIQYNGKKFYRDKTTLRNAWNPGDSHLVPQADAKILLRFGVFSEVEGSAKAIEQDEALAIAKTQQEVLKVKEEQKRNELESMLMTVESMDKGALEAYARHYEVELDKRRSVTALRQEVSLLIEQFGVR